MPDETPPKKDFTALEAVGIVWEIGVMIAVPTVLFALGGRWLDNRYGTSPWFLALGLLSSLAVSALLVVKKGREVAKKL